MKQSGVVDLYRTRSVNTSDFACTSSIDLEDKDRLEHLPKNPLNQVRNGREPSRSWRDSFRALNSLLAVPISLSHSG